MAKTYHRADQDVLEMAQDLIKQFHPHLLEPRPVKIDILMVLGATDENGNRSGTAITHGGYPCLGLARIVNLKDRAKGCGDAEILLDGDHWAEMAETQQRALLDHELHHFALKRDVHNVPQSDDYSRPCLRIRKHDYDFGWFTIIAKRHKDASQEVIQARRIVEKSGQFYLPGFGIGGDQGPELNFDAGTYADFGLDPVTGKQPEPETSTSES
jgi:Putative phage metallopeptidase